MGFVTHSQQQHIAKEKNTTWLAMPRAESSVITLLWKTRQNGSASFSSFRTVALFSIRAPELVARSI
jgi:hypothetical protein